MKFFKLMVAVVSVLVAEADNDKLDGQPRGHVLTDKNLKDVDQLQALQGAWEGIGLHNPAKQKITVMILGDLLYFHRDENFWFKTNFTLTAGTDPQQLKTNIMASSDEGIVDEEVIAIYKIEDGKMTLVTIADAEDVSITSFETTGPHYELRKVNTNLKSPKELEKEFDALINQSKEDLPSFTTPGQFDFVGEPQ